MFLGNVPLLGDDVELRGETVERLGDFFDAGDGGVAFGDGTR